VTAPCVCRHKQPDESRGNPALNSVVRNGSNFESLFGGLSLSVSAPPSMVSPVYLLTCPRSLGLWQPHPAQQVGVAGVGAKVVNPQVSYDEVGDVRRSLSVCFFEKFERSVLLT
jgi:hypothetical protein